MLTIPETDDGLFQPVKALELISNKLQFVLEGLTKLLEYDDSPALSGATDILGDATGDLDTLVQWLKTETEPSSNTTNPLLPDGVFEDIFDELVKPCAPPEEDKPLNDIESNLTEKEITILKYLTVRPTWISTGELVNVLDISRTTVAKYIKLLHEKQFIIKRESDPRYTRKTYWGLAAKYATNPIRLQRILGMNKE